MGQNASLKNKLNTIIMKTKTLLLAALVGAAAVSANAGVSFGLSVNLPLPVVYASPVVVATPTVPAPCVETVSACPDVDYVWAPGYWVYRNMHYVWVHGGWNYRPAHTFHGHRW
jgi:hypothetical protein